VALLPSLLALLLTVPASHGRVYPVPILADNEDDLRLLLADETLTEEDLEVLLELLADPVDLNRARKNVIYDLPGVSLSLAEAIVADRKAKGPFENHASLRRVEGVTPEVLQQIVPFSEVTPPVQVKQDLKGKIRLRSAWAWEKEDIIIDDHANHTHNARQLGYDRVPNTYLSARLRYRKWLDMGFLGLAQDGISGIAYDPEGRDFYATWRSPMPEFGKAFVRAKRLKYEAILGSYTAGFGVGLTFDNSNRTHPHGLYTDLTISGTDRFSLRKGLMGLGASFFDLALGANATVDATVFASSWEYDIYQYDIGVSGGSELDPVVDDTDSPRIYVENSDGEFYKGGWLRMPNAYRESLVGANSTLRFLDSAELGVTAWVGHLDMTSIEGVEHEDELMLRGGYPQEHTFGAVGANAAYELGLLDLRGEFAHSFTGGQAVLIKGIFDAAIGEVETSLRHYGTEFDNPHARGMANADEYAGYRDRDEQGARIKAQLEPADWLSTRLMGDIWQRMSTGVWNMELYGRVAVEPHQAWSLVALADHKNRHIGINERSGEYGGDWVDPAYEDYDPLELDDGYDDVVEGAGSKNYWGAQLRSEAIPRTTLTAFYKRIYEDAAYWYPAQSEDAYCEYWYQVGHYTWAKLQFKPTDNTWISARFRYEDEDVHGSKGEHDIETYLQIDQKLPKKIKLALRGTLVHELSDPEADWWGPCQAAGAPDLNGSCIDASDAIEALAEELENDILVQFTFEWRF